MDGSPPAFSCKWIQCGWSGLMQGELPGAQRATVQLDTHTDAQNSWKPWNLKLMN